MRKIYIFILTVFAFACGNDYHDENGTKEEQIYAESAVEIIKALGFDVEEMIEDEQGYLVEGDWRFTYETIEELKQEPLTRLTSTDRLKTLEEVKEIWVYIKEKSSTDIVLEAMSKWNSIPGCCVNFRETGILDKAQIIYWDAYDTRKPYYELLFSKNGPTEIFLNWTNYDYLWSDHKAGEVITHFLGRALGLGHTPTHEGEVWGRNSHILGTKTYDPKSIMQKPKTGPSYYDPWRDGMSEHDRIGAALVFPKDDIVSITHDKKSRDILPGDVVNFTAVHTDFAMPSSYNYAWYINDKIDHNTTFWLNSMSKQFMEAGKQKISILLSGVENTRKELEIEVLKPKLKIEADRKISGGKQVEVKATYLRAGIYDVKFEFTWPSCMIPGAVTTGSEIIDGRMYSKKIRTITYPYFHKDMKDFNAVVTCKAVDKKTGIVLDEASLVFHYEQSGLITGPPVPIN